MSDTVTDTIVCIGKNLLNNHKLSISIVICPILSDTITFQIFSSKSTCITSSLKILGFETIQSLWRFKFFGVKYLYRFVFKNSGVWNDTVASPIQIFCIKVLVSLHNSKLLGFYAIQSLYRYFPQVIQHQYRFNRHFFFSRPPLLATDRVRCAPTVQTAAIKTFSAHSRPSLL